MAHSIKSSADALRFYSNFDFYIIPMPPMPGIPPPIGISAAFSSGTSTTAASVVNKEVVVLLPAGSVLIADPLTLKDATLANLVLVKAERGTDNSLKLTYRYTVPADASFDATAFEASIQALVDDGVKYAIKWIVNHTVYDSKEAAEAAQGHEGTGGLIP